MAPSTASECESPRRTDHLWTKIDFRNPEHAKCCLERSGSAPIDVTVENITEEELGPTPWVERTRSLFVGAGRYESPENLLKIVERLCQNAPNLQSLEIIGRIETPYNDKPIVLPPNLLANAPSLHTLKFFHVSPSIVPTFSLSKLTCIEWYDPGRPSRSAPLSPWATRFSFENLLKLFESSPLLEKAKIEVPVQNPMGKPLEKVTLNNLHRLEYWGSNSLVHYIVAPKLTWLTIDVFKDDNSQHQPTTPSSILPPDLLHIPLLSEPTRVIYRCEPDENDENVTIHRCIFCYPTKGHELYVGEYISHGYSYEWFPHLVHPFSSKVLELDLTLIDMAVFPVHFAIGKFEKLEKLHLKKNISWLLAVLKRDTGGPVPCNMLSEIHVVGSNKDKDRPFDSSMLRSLLSERKKSGCEVKNLHISKLNVTAQAIEELKEVVGEVHSHRIFQSETGG